MPTTTPACPSGGASRAACCGPYIKGDALPPDAATLMRSRYSAYVLRDEA
jgi:SEC-C motif-containing protein